MDREDVREPDQDGEDTLSGDLLDESGEPLDPLGNPRRNPIPRLPALAPRREASRGSGGDLLAFYLSEVRRHALLDPEEERSVALAFYESGDGAAAERLV